MNRGLVGAIMILAVSISLTACSSSGPTVSGFGFGNSRLVSVGDPVVIRLPASTRTGQAEWRLTSFDSGRLQLVQRPTLEAAGSSSRRQWTVRFVARGFGDTTVEFSRVQLRDDGGGRLGETRRFTISVGE
ncbi:MAG: protease inhibitor I42 family protein [Planctomycetes bacterium]|nr:protease inhibitor I42 family protein [Planctomycetota bacterium]